jgi:hypothetical protein
MQGVPFKTHPKDQTHKYWNKNTISCPPAAYDATYIAELSSRGSLPAFRFVGYQWRGNCVIDSEIVFDKKVFMRWTYCLLRTKHGYTPVDTLILKTVQHGVLKTHMRCMKVLCISQNWYLVCIVSKTNCGTIVLWRYWRGAFSVSAVVVNTLFMTFMIYLKA